MPTINYDDLEKVDTQILLTEESKSHDSRLQVELGKRYYRADGVDFDANKTVEFYKAAANQKNDEAQMFLGNLARATNDYEEALKYFEKAASLGNDKAQYILGEMYEHGEGTASNQDNAIELYQKAAKSGNFLAQEKLKNWNLS